MNVEIKSNSLPDVPIKQSAEGIVFLYRNLAEGLPWYLLVPFALVIAYYNVEHWQTFVVWTTFFYLLSIPKLFLARYFIKSPLPKTQIELKRWRLWVIVPSLLSGILWGVSPFIFFELGAQHQQLVLLTILNGVTLTTLVLSTYCLPAFVAFLLPAMAGEFIYFAAFAEPHYRIIAVLPLMMVVVLLMIGRNAREQTRKAELLRKQNLQLVERLTLEKERVESASNAKSRFLAAANHDLRQPVHSLTLLTDALRNLNLDPQARNLVDYIGHSVESLDKVLSSLLDISRLDAGVMKVSPTPTNLKPLVAAIIQEVSSTAERKQLKLKQRIEDIYVYTDPVLLSSILRNLIENALQYTERGGVLVGLRNRQNTLVLQVWDTGEGIPESQLEDVFVEFYRSSRDSAEQRDGLGLGLSIARRISQLLGHTLSVKSRVGRGTVFELELPKLDRQNVVPVSTETMMSTFPLKGRRVLVVDNEVSILQGTLAVLDRWGCDVDIASSAEEALQLVTAGRLYDIYLCDYQLGKGPNGVELLHQFRAYDRGEVPGIIMTGNTDPDFLKSSDDAAYVLLHKPVRPAQLRALMSQYARITSDKTNGGSALDA